MEISEFLPENKTQLIATGIAIAVYFLAKYILKKATRKYGHLTHKAEGRIAQMRQIMVILLNILLLLSLAIIWGAQNLLTGFAAVFAVLGVAMFAQWSVLSNITAGIVMFFSAPYHLGDKIRLLDKDIPIVATIESIKTFYTHIRTEEGELVVLPNNIFLQKVVSIISEEEE